MVINEDTSFEGALPEDYFLLYVLKSIEKLSNDDKSKLKELEDSIYIDDDESIGDE